jgi:hypothetical protein
MDHMLDNNKATFEQYANNIYQYRVVYSIVYEIAYGYYMDTYNLF